MKQPPNTRAWQFALAALAVTFAGFACRSINYVSPEEQALFAIAELVQAEAAHRTQTGRYGRMKDLTQAGDERLLRLLESSRKAGYLLDLELSEERFVIRGVPEQERRGEPGWQRSFYADESMVVRHSWTQAADEHSEVAERIVPRPNPGRPTL